LLTKHDATTDIIVVSGTSAAYVVASLLGLPIGWTVSFVAGILTLYLVCVLRRRSETWRDYGVRVDNFREAAWRVGCWTLVAALLILMASLALGNTISRPELLLLLPLYPLWGILQQFIFQGILHRALMTCIVNRNMALLVNSLLFAAVHLSDWRVVALTFPAGLCWSWFYQRWPNIWVLGISHGLLGGLAYPLLLGQNTLQQVF
jgi:membrane protease YdiL (CAAX protease family)